MRKISFSTEDYTKMLQDLLPQGEAWPRNRDNKLYYFLQSFGEELNKLNSQGIDLLNESYPETVNQLIGKYEKMLGLPNEVFSIPSSLSDRRSQVIFLLTLQVNPTEDCFASVIAFLGSTLDSIDTFDSFLVGVSGAGDAIGAGVYAWTIRFNISGATSEEKEKIKKYLDILRPEYINFIYSFA